ncbi:MAG: hypothetical protein LUQ39_06905 [Methanomassiliicoccales archaeon]|nr:hypothetical protein [Methanomassiliicoccales archaeon]
MLNDPSSVKMLATKSPEGVLHAIAVGSLTALDPNTIICGVVFMKQTHNNMEKMRKSSERPAILVVNGNSAYQIHAAIKNFMTKGPALDMMNEKLKARGITVTGVWFMEPESVFNQSPGPNVGKRIA